MQDTYKYIDLGAEGKAFVDGIGKSVCRWIIYRLGDRWIRIR